MTAIQLTLIPHKTLNGLAYQHLHIQLTTTDQIIEPQDLKGLKLPKNVQWPQGIVIEGKAPIWLYGYLVHQCHSASWVGCYDTRLGAVVVATHTHAVALGEVLPVQLPGCLQGSLT